jgi:hypothetical protein
MDIFSLPEMTLLSCVNDFFMRHNIDYEPVHLYKDVKINVPRIGPPAIVVIQRVSLLEQVTTRWLRMRMFTGTVNLITRNTLRGGCEL